MDFHLSDIVIGITFYGFEAGQKLVRSRSNYFAHDGQRAPTLVVISYEMAASIRSSMKYIIKPLEFIKRLAIFQVLFSKCFSDNIQNLHSQNFEQYS